MCKCSMAVRFAWLVLIHASAGFALYAWQVMGIEPAGSLFVFWMWFVAILFSINVFALANPPKKRQRKNKALGALNLSCWLFFIGALVWLGYVVLPAFIVFGLLATSALQARYDADGNLKETPNA